MASSLSICSCRWVAIVACCMASMALRVGLSPIRGVLSNYNASLVTIGGAIVGAAKLEGLSPGVMKPGGPVPGVVKLRGPLPRGVEIGVRRPEEWKPEEQWP